MPRTYTEDHMIDTLTHRCGNSYGDLHGLWGTRSCSWFGEPPHGWDAKQVVEMPKPLVLRYPLDLDDFD